MTPIKIDALHILLIAPCAPPKNDPESIQVGRLLEALEPNSRVTLVTTPAAGGWQRADNSLALKRPKTDIIDLRLPFHRLTHRVLSSNRLSKFHRPDSDYWLPWLASHVVNQLRYRPDVIYSRSCPYSAAVLAKRLKEKLGLPWMMHLSDPWADSPYRGLEPNSRHAADEAIEAACIRSADLIALTTEGQASFYQNKYPTLADKVIVCPNMMPPRSEIINVESRNSARKLLKDVQRGGSIFNFVLNFVHTGAIYGERDPSAIISALEILRERGPEISGGVRFHFIGNMYPQVAALIDASPQCIRHNSVSFNMARALQAEADVLVSIEPKGSDPLLKHLLLGKVVDYVALEKPILALTPEGSETEILCRSGRGWALEPDDSEGLAQLLADLLERAMRGKRLMDFMGSRPAQLEPQTVVTAIMAGLENLVDVSASRGS